MACKASSRNGGRFGLMQLLYSVVLPSAFCLLCFVCSKMTDKHKIVRSYVLETQQDDNVLFIGFLDKCMSVGDLSSTLYWKFPVMISMFGATRPA